MMWGKHKENGIWFAKKRQRKLLVGGGRMTYMALGRFRFRLMWPHRNSTCCICQ